MKLIHLSDLHIGKRVNDFTMIEDQKFIINEILNIIKCNNIDGVIIAGDLYDKAVPQGEAIKVVDDFLTELSIMKKPVFIISGNHDSPERVSFGARLMAKSQIHIAQIFNGQIEKFNLIDDNGEVDIYLLPFMKPINVRKYFDEENIENYNDGIKVLLNEMNLDKSKRNVLVCHQFVTGAITSDSEELAIGGLDNVDGNLFDEFDYVALGHIHRPQQIVRREVRYAGSPLKYSFSECNHNKSVTIVTLGAKGEVDIELIPLVPLRDMKEIKGTFDEIIKGKSTTDYLHITLTDEEDKMDGLSKLREIYPNIMKLDYDNSRTKDKQEILGFKEDNSKSTLEVFDEFYYVQNNKNMTKEQMEYMDKIIEKL